MLQPTEPAGQGFTLVFLNGYTDFLNDTLFLIKVLKLALKWKISYPTNPNPHLSIICFCI